METFVFVDVQYNIHKTINIIIILCLNFYAFFASEQSIFLNTIVLVVDKKIAQNNLKEAESVVNKQVIGK